MFQMTSAVEQVLTNGVLQYAAIVAVCCCLLQYVAVRFSVLQCIAVYIEFGCRVLKYLAECCSMLQYVSDD